MKKILLLMLLVLSLTVLLAACMRRTVLPSDSVSGSTGSSAALSVGGSVDPTGAAGTTTTGGPATSRPPVTNAPETTARPAYETLTLASSEIYTGSLILVNPSSPYCYQIASLYAPSELDKLSAGALNELGWTSLYANKTDNYLLRSRLLYLRSDVYAAFNRMMQEFASRTGHRDVQVRYAYQLVSDAKDGASLADERCTGLALEVNIYTDEGTFSIDHSAKRADYYEWFSANCHRYGFIMNGESGYFRYVGVPHATYMMRNGMTLESYLGYLRGFTVNKPLSVVDDEGVLWSLWYVPVGDGSLTEAEIPYGVVPQISGNNRDGFIFACR